MWKIKGKKEEDKRQYCVFSVLYCSCLWCVQLNEYEMTVIKCEYLQ